MNSERIFQHFGFAEMCYRILREIRFEGHQVDEPQPKSLLSADKAKAASAHECFCFFWQRAHSKDNKFPVKILKRIFRQAENLNLRAEKIFQRIETTQLIKGFSSAGLFQSAGEKLEFYSKFENLIA